MTLERMDELESMETSYSKSIASSTHDGISNTEKKHSLQQNIDSLESEGVVETGEVVNVINKSVEKGALKKMDLVISPIIAFLYLMAFLDRSNIGNASVAGMTEDLNLYNERLNVAISIFYVLYILVETPSVILVKHFRPSRMLAFISFAWSIVVLFSGFISSYGGLIVTRLILGLLEGCLFPALNLYLTTVYTREEQCQRLSYLFCASGLAGAFGGLFAYALEQVHVGVPLSLFLLPDDMEKSWFLNPQERQVASLRKEANLRYLGQQKFEWKEVRKAFKDLKVYVSATSQFCADMVLYGFSSFLPTIVKGIGFTGLQSNYMTIPVYIAGVIAFLIAANASDRTKIRSPYLISASIIAAVGYIILIASNSNAAKFTACFIVAIGCYIGPGMNLGWLNNNVAGHYKRATAIGIQQTIANSSGIVAGQIYRSTNAPRYILGHSFTLGCVLVGLIGYIVLFFSLRNANKKRDERCARGEYDPTLTGDYADDFRYYL
ncbi:nicotinic acid plasma membrane transporter [Schizosaccharomyces cryophilus OY26]|uniref:Nicotinic acid plasma membrane transporter n=1 Tax=Schizosaccharomyces cryophilus (strain OY26 / ATCC MYA-4695 / CBS 11777 / NBRC 106824 / NRRL Y48691) TaxID=653667 RepID=S9W419_SCHCR|nr:nicotinic acid plasma membrane transporter [Schizosaccharomyces cryophilus OY26]EPY52710.1 nicotinic acid plasma membrane transporter [Schizosaccharomyces cryophilus OY26]